jgi:hypothetical protein
MRLHPVANNCRELASCGFRASLAGLVAWALAGEVRASTIVVPNQFESVAGNSNATQDPDVHAQYIYGISQFPDFP